MGYSLTFRRTASVKAEYHHEKEQHLARDAAHAILLQGFDLLGIECINGAYPVAREECLAAQEARSFYRKQAGVNLYASEDAFALKRFREAHPSN